LKRDLKGREGKMVLSNKQVILFIIGPTAVGKTEFGIRLAQHLDSEIVGADSMQIYKYMDIGTGKPVPEERTQAKHHLIDFVHPEDGYSVGHYKKDSDAVIGELHDMGKIPIVVGGTGLYIRSITDGLFEGPEADPDLRKLLKETALNEGANSLYNQLKRVDPVATKRIHPNDERRLVRALEVYRITGKPISELQEEQRAMIEEQYRFVMIGLNNSRNRLYADIENRVDRMIEKGLVDEVRSLLKMGVREDAVSMQGLGYKELIPYLKKERPLEKAVKILKQETRHFAKRQITWFKADQRIQWLDIGVFETRGKAIRSMIDLVDQQLEASNGGMTNNLTSN
jgi:tRNA dimethylallyltransferase